LGSKNSLAAAFAEKENIFPGKIKIDFLPEVQIHDLIGDQPNRHPLKINVDNLIVALVLGVQRIEGQVYV
jgi:hypothetical protein